MPDWLDVEILNILNLINENKRFKYFVLLIALSACNEGERNFEALQKVKEGMHINEVHNIMPNDPRKTRMYGRDKNLFIESYAAKHHIFYEMKDSTVAKIMWGD